MRRAPVTRNGGVARSRSSRRRATTRRCAWATRAIVVAPRRQLSPPPSFDPSAPVVSFKTDVFPIFGFSCAFSTCHGSTAGSSNGIFLGGNKPETVRTNLVDVPAPELPSMAFVKAGDPRNSYLMRKLDGSNCVLDAQCTDGDCGDSMPQNEDKLAIEQRDLVRRWIAQGAPTPECGGCGDVTISDAGVADAATDR